MSEMTVPNQPGLVERLGERARMVRRNMKALHRWWSWQCWWARFSIESAALGFQIRNGLPIV